MWYNFLVLVHTLRYASSQSTWRVVLYIRYYLILRHVLRNQIIHSNTIIDMAMVQTWVQGIAAGMLHLHTEGVIHRDLAARNVLLTLGGQAKISGSNFDNNNGS